MMTTLEQTIAVNSPRAAYLAHKDEIDEAIAAVLDSGWYILGEQVRSFEEEFARACGCRFAVGVANGTDAIQLALRAGGIGPGDQVLTVSNTAVATVSAIDLTGATPVLVDVDRETFVVTVDTIEQALRGNDKVRAIVAVHLFGHPAPIDEITAVAERRDLLVIEDCAQAHGATLKGRPVGSFGDLAAFSFYPTKNLAAIGDGGAVTTSDPGLAEKLQMLRQYGWRERYISAETGLNSRLDELQAAILRVRLRYLDEGNRRRRAIAAVYDEACAATNAIEPPSASAGVVHVYHQYVVRSPVRDALKVHLQSRGVATAVLYPQPIHLQPGYASRVVVAAGGLPITEMLAQQILCLPMYPELTDAQVEHVAGAIRHFVPTV